MKITNIHKNTSSQTAISIGVALKYLATEASGEGLCNLAAQIEIAEVAALEDARQLSYLDPNFKRGVEQ